jgi:hypothetical protein
MFLQLVVTACCCPCGASVFHSCSVSCSACLSVFLTVLAAAPVVLLLRLLLLLRRRRLLLLAGHRDSLSALQCGGLHPSPTRLPARHQPLQATVPYQLGAPVKQTNVT